MIVLIISPITKYLIEKYDIKFTGREIVCDWAYVNPFTGYIYLSDLKIYELNNDSIFFSANGCSANFEMHKIFSKTYEISELHLNKPKGVIIQDSTGLNFNDLIKLFSSKGDSGIAREPVHFNILSINIVDGELHYYEKIIPVNYSIKKLNIESTGLQWNADTIAAKFDFLSGTGDGNVKGNFTINTKSLDYRLAVVIQKFDLNVLEQYLKDMMNYGNFSAHLDADLKTSGNFNDRQDITVAGLLEITEFHIGKSPLDDYASFAKAMLKINEISPKKLIYNCDTIRLKRPYLKYERYDYLDNIQTMFGKAGTNVSAVYGNQSKFNLVIEIASYISALSKNFFKSDYKINSLAITDAHLVFNDYSLGEKFNIELDPLFVRADSINKNHTWVNVSLESSIKPYGNMAMSLRINPKDNGDFDLQYGFTKLPISMFNPYIISYTSFPFDRGSIELAGQWNVRKEIIQSDNHVKVVDLRLAKRLKKEDNKWIPMPLVMGFVRDRGNVIDYEIPITGNLNDPKFHLKDVFFDVLENMFIKPATIPYRMQVKKNETEIEKFLTLKWDLMDNFIERDQERFLKRMADFLAKNPEESISVYPQLYSMKEREYILLFEAKKKYFLETNNLDINSFNEKESKMVEMMSVKDPSFIRYISKKINDSLAFSIQDKCSKLIDPAIVDA
ncbi:MAG: DUF748 domain-containing protein, partial [Cytophagaceae bacterium]